MRQCASNLTVAIQHEDVHQVITTTSFRNPFRACRTRSDVNPALVKTVSTIFILITNCSEGDSSSVVVSQSLVCLESRRSSVERDAKSTRDRLDNCAIASSRSSRSTAVCQLSQSIVDLKHVRRCAVDCDFQLTSLRVVSNNATSDVTRVSSEEVIVCPATNKSCIILKSYDYRVTVNLSIDVSGRERNFCASSEFPPAEVGCAR